MKQERGWIYPIICQDFNLNLSEQDLALLEMMERLEKTL